MQGLLIDYEFCYGCHVCEMACKTEHGFEHDKRGIELHKMGPREMTPGNWECAYVPIPTSNCDLCADRTSQGKLPTCVHHCNAKVMEYGPVEELQAKLASKPKVVIFSVGE